MRAIVTTLSLLAILVCAWLVTMYFALQHPGYQQRAALVAGLGLIAVATLLCTLLAHPPMWLRAGVAVGALILVYVGVSFISANHRSTHFEGYAEISGALFVALGASTLVRATSWLTVRT